MKKVIFLLIAIFALCATIEANAAPTDKRPKKGYNYQKQRAKEARHSFFYNKQIHRQNGGCGWMRNR